MRLRRRGMGAVGASALVVGLMALFWAAAFLYAAGIGSNSPASSSSSSSGSLAGTSTSRSSPTASTSNSATHSTSRSGTASASTTSTSTAASPTESASSTTSSSTTSAQGTVDVTVVHAHLVAQVHILGLNVTQLVYDVNLTGFRAEAGSVVNYSYSVQNTIGLTGTVTVGSVSITTPGFSILSTNPTLPLRLTLTPNEKASITVAIQTPGSGYTGPISVTVLATYN